MAYGVCKGVYLRIFGRSHQLLLNKFLDTSTTSMRKGCDGEKKMENGKNGGEIMKFIVAINVIAIDRPNVDRLECRPLVPTSRKVGRAHVLYFRIVSG